MLSLLYSEYSSHQAVIKLKQLNLLHLLAMHLLNLDISKVKLHFEQLSLSFMHGNVYLKLYNHFVNQTKSCFV